MNFIKVWILENIILSIGGTRQMLEKIKQFFSGKKTVLASIVMICQAVLDFIVTGDLIKLIDTVTEALGLVVVRDSISKLPIMKAKVITFLDGYKTYILMTINIINACVGYSATGDLGKLMNDIALALGLLGLRAGAKKLNQ